MQQCVYRKLQRRNGVFPCFSPLRVKLAEVDAANAVRISRLVIENELFLSPAFHTVEFSYKLERTPPYFELLFETKNGNRLSADHATLVLLQEATKLGRYLLNQNIS